MLNLPGHLLAGIATTTHLKPLHPPNHHDSYTSLSLQYLDKTTDIAIAGMIHYLPNLENINLKGCSLAGEQVVKTILKRCENLKRINIKGTKISEGNVRSLLEEFGEQLTGFKMNFVSIQVSSSLTLCHRSPRL